VENTDNWKCMFKTIGHQYILEINKSQQVHMLSMFLLTRDRLIQLSMMLYQYLLWVFLCSASAAWAHSDVSMFGALDSHTDHPVQSEANSTLYPATVVLDERRVINIIIKINARLVGQHDLYIGKYVSKGEVLAEIESAELETLQRAYIATVSNLAAVDAFSVTSGAKVADGKLNLIWRGMSETDVNQIDQTKESLKQVKIRAPIAGFISKIAVVNDQIVNGGMQTGQTAAAGTLFASIADPSGILLEASIPAAKAAQLKIGQPAMVRIPGKDEKLVELRSQVIQIYGFINPVTQRRLVRLKLDQHTNSTLINGLMVSVSIPAGKQEEKHDHGEHHDD
jgi:multidrug efflux pump subunit AcrA (membrane-fusion protein)